MHLKLTPTCRVFAALCLLMFSLPCAAAKPLKVFLLVGQSNMQGHAKVTTLAHAAMDPKMKPLVDKILDKDGTARVAKDVWISYLSSKNTKNGNLQIGFGADESKIGPELAFGITMQEHLGETILLVKAAWGGKSLHTDFRPPSAGPYPFSKQEIENAKKRGKDVEKLKKDKATATGHYYRLTIAHVQWVLQNLDKVNPGLDKKYQPKLSGIVWFQGWNDMVAGSVYPDRGKPGGYDEYSELLGHFIRDMRKDLNAPKLPFVIGVMGVGGPTAEYGSREQRYKATHQNFRDAMAAPASLPEFRGNVVAVRTEDFWDMELNDLVKRDGALNQQVNKARKEQKLNGKQARELKKELRSKEFTEKELEILEKGVSNAAYHYLGSGKIMLGIGTGFAEAMARMVKK